MKNIRAHVLLRRPVPGLGYSAWFEQKARQRGLCGWIRDLPDGKIEILLEGAERDARAMVEDARRGPTCCGIEEIRSNFNEYLGEFKEFQTR